MTRTPKSPSLTDRPGWVVWVESGRFSYGSQIAYLTGKVG